MGVDWLGCENCGGLIDTTGKCLAGCDTPDEATRIRELEAEVERLRAWTDQAVLDLLAVIHRDGGHWTGEHGVAVSAEDAERIVVSLREGYEYHKDRAERLERAAKKAWQILEDGDSNVFTLDAAHEVLEQALRGEES